MLIQGLNNIIDISTNDYHSLALTSNGQIYGFGSNVSGELAFEFDPDDYNIHTPRLLPLINIISISAGKYHSLALTIDGKVYAFGNNKSGSLGLGDNNPYIPTLIPGLSNIRQISAGNEYSLTLSNDSNLYVFGNNEYGQLGLGDYDNKSVPTLLPGFKILNS